MTELPATLAGLWTAITATHDAVMTIAAADGQGSAGDLADVARHCTQAADTLAGSRPQGIAAVDDALATPATAGGGTAVRDLTNICIELAVEVLGNEDEPLSPPEIVAITRAVTSLCAARAAALGVHA
jgi:hypothetical protein